MSKFKGVEYCNGRWRYRFQIDKKRYCVYLDSEPRSQRELKAIQKEAAGDHSEDFGDAGKLSFDQAAEKFLKDSEGVLSPSTIKNYMSIRRTLPESFQHHRLSSIGQSELNAIVRQYSDRKPKTVRNVHGFILSVIHYYNPDFTAHTKLPVWNEPEYYAPEPEDVKRILNKVSGTIYEIPYQLAIMGLRRSEICAVSSSDLDGDFLTISKTLVVSPDGGYTIKQSTKTGYTRTLQLPHELAEKIRQQGRAYSGEPNALENNLRRIQKQLGIQHFTLHKFRHYFVSQGSAMGIPDKYLQEAGGWKTDRVMKRRYLQAQKSKTLESGARYVQYVNGLIG